MIFKLILIQIIMIYSFKFVYTVSDNTPLRGLLIYKGRYSLQRNERKNHILIQNLNSKFKIKLNSN
jgi:hypothetical protein